MQKEITINKEEPQLNTSYSKLYVNEGLKLAFLQVYFSGNVTGDAVEVITFPVNTKGYTQFWVPITAANGGAYTGRLVVIQNAASLIVVGGTINSPFASILFPIE